MKVLIITGGTSSERRISFMSAKQVKKALEEVGHKVKLFDLKKGSQLKKFCGENNIPTSPWKRVKHKDDLIQFGFPSVLKSSTGGSSREVVLLKSTKDLKGYRDILPKTYG